MSLLVVLDADFLSAFLKIERLPLVREFYQAEELVVPPAVYREVAVTDLLEPVLALRWIRVQSPAGTRLETLGREEPFAALGAGEQEAIALALEHSGAALLMNDNQARHVAARCGLNAVNIPAFLLACKWAGLLDPAAMRHLITSLLERDHYRFRDDVRDLLLR